MDTKKVDLPRPPPGVGVEMCEHCRSVNHVQAEYYLWDRVVVPGSQLLGCHQAVACTCWACSVCRRLSPARDARFKRCRDPPSVLSWCTLQ